MSKFFGAAIELESQNKSRNYDLALEKFCFTQCGWIRLFTTVSMGMTITNFWKMFRSGVIRYHHDKLIGIRIFSEIISLDFFNNIFTIDTGTPEKNITPLDDIYKGQTVSNFCALHVSSYIYPST